jgi:sulfate adenylyltransferase subunit 1 (EFTu-like GTPase family)
MRCTTQAIPATVRAIRRRIDSSTLAVIGENAPRLEEHEVGEIVLALTAPAVVETYAAFPELGRFVLERGADIVAAGIITACGE